MEITVDAKQAQAEIQNIRKGAMQLKESLEKQAGDPISTPVWIDEEGGDPPHLQVGREY